MLSPLLLSLSGLERSYYRLFSFSINLGTTLA